MAAAYAAYSDLVPQLVASAWRSMRTGGGGVSAVGRPVLGWARMAGGRSLLAEPQPAGAWCRRSTGCIGSEAARPPAGASAAATGYGCPTRSPRCSRRRWRFPHGSRWWRRRQRPRMAWAGRRWRPRRATAPRLWPAPASPKRCWRWARSSAPRAPGGLLPGRQQLLPTWLMVRRALTSVLFLAYYCRRPSAIRRRGSLSSALARVAASNLRYPPSSGSWRPQADDRGRRRTFAGLRADRRGVDALMRW